MYSLSDPNDQRFRLSCDSHPTNPHSNHSMRCSRCQQFKDSLGDMRSLVAELLKDARDDGNAFAIKRYEDLEAEVHNAETKIINMKKHLVRAELANRERISIINALEPNSAFITMDWMMKWLPRKAREKTEDWYGQKGISVHIADVKAKVPGIGNLVQNTFVHIFGTDEKQVNPLYKLDTYRHIICTINYRILNM
uniref:Uncharacterized protein n=1 Tax=Acrobeloides nanus TaxID=290746 RepID=A0A914DEQ9_9BILA